MNKKVDKSLETVRENNTLINKNNAFLNALLIVQKSNSISLCLLKINMYKNEDSNRAY